MSYFTAVLARDGRAWTFHDLDVDSQSTLTELTADLRGVAEEDQPVLLLVEREDAWWAVVRVDGDDDPRVFVSDIAGAVASPYAELLAVADEEDEDLAPGVCGGDLDLLSDLGTSPESLREMCDDQLLPMDALAAVAEAGGFAEQLDSLR
ncbi:MAG TPA: tRNA adenosine deaminase-associated protein [Actinomycetes bacterium]